MTILADISAAIIAGDHTAAAERTRQAIAQRLPPKTILDEGLIAGMTVVGDRFRDHEIFLPDVLLAARAMYAGMDLLKARLIGEGIPSAGTVVIGSVRGDLHDIGKNLVGIMLRGAGFDVVDLGHDVQPARMVETARDRGAQVIGMSALLTTTMPAMREVVELLKQERLAGKVRTIVGGAPVTDAFARSIGADAYAFDAANAVQVVKDLVGRR